MIARQLIRFFLLVALMLSVASAQEQSSVAGDGPGEGDIAIMQKEIKWGMQEMQRYKMLRGEWPVRTIPDVVEETQTQLEVASRSRREKPTKQPHNNSVRGGSAPPQDDTAHSTYWKLLVSVF